METRFENAVIIRNADLGNYGSFYKDWTSILIQEKDQPDKHMLVMMSSSQQCCEVCEILETNEDLADLGECRVVTADCDIDYIENLSDENEDVRFFKNWLNDTNTTEEFNYITLSVYREDDENPIYTAIFYNCHNGFYFHEIRVGMDGELVYSTEI